MKPSHFLLVILGFAIAGCHNYLNSPCNCSAVEEVAFRLVGRDTATLAMDTALAHCYSISDSVLGDERVKWPGFVLKQGTETVAYAEARPDNPAKIVRFTAIKPVLATKEGLHPKMWYKDAKAYLSKGKFITAPDGYLKVQDPHNSKITYTLNTSGYPAIYTGTNDFNAIADSVVLEKIEVTNW